MEGRESGRPAPELLREHCQVFSRLGWAMLAYLAATFLLQTGVLTAALLAAPQLAASPLFQWLLAAPLSYGVGLLVFFLVIRAVPAPPAVPAQPLSPGMFLRVYVICLGATYLVNFLTLSLLQLVGLLRGAPVENPVAQTAAYPAILNVLLGCVLAPAVEELMFRKLLLDRLRPYGGRFAVAASALCFGLFHGNLNQFFYACAIGLVLGWVALTTGRIWQAMALHALINAVSTVLLPLLEPLGAVGDMALGCFVLGAVALGAAFFAGLRRELNFPDAPTPLPPRWTWRVFFESPGVACFVLLALALCATWLL